MPLVAVIATLLSANDLSRIVGGTVVTDQQRVPYMTAVGIVDRGRFMHICGGTLISSRLVLTAAHCIAVHRERLLESGVVFIGQTAPSDAKSAINISQVHIHPRFSEASLHMDVGAVRLAHSAPKTRTPALPSVDSTYAGRYASILGWGTVAEGSSLLSHQLLEAVVPVDAECGRYAAELITPSMICAGAPGKDACQGDSGGPLLMCDTPNGCEVIGVTSWGNGCARRDFPGVYAKVFPARDWLEQLILQPAWSDCSGRDASRDQQALGNGVCDDGTTASSAVNFNCEAFQCDRGDCGTSCLPGAIRDCNGVSADSSWLGDGQCDDGTFGIDFNCPIFACDRGDCPCPTARIQIKAGVLRSAYRSQCCGLGDDCVVQVDQVAAEPRLRISAP
tara:strand:- start:536 stop:1711 length:1176 start_codon:yes stop_codon:yes gene_type:complete